MLRCTGKPEQLPEILNTLLNAANMAHSDSRVTSLLGGKFFPVVGFLVISIAHRPV